jgi:glutaredoxin
MFAVRLLAHGSECRVCDAARKFLSDHVIPFEEFDIDRNPSALQELVERTGSATHVPVVIVGEETFIDFNEDIATRILELQGENRSAKKPNEL